MAEYFEVEDVVKEYDSRIFKRILSYVKPYRALTVAAILALALSTVGELLMPVMIQRIIDTVIMAKYTAVNMVAFNSNKKTLSPEAILAVEHFRDADDSEMIGDRLFFPQGNKSAMTKKTETELTAAHIVDGDDWYLFSYEKESAVRDLVLSRQDIFSCSSCTSAIHLDDLYTLSPAEVRLVRGGDLSFIWYAVIFFFIILSIVFLATFVQTWTTSLIGQRVMEDIRLALFKKTAGQSTDFLSRHPVGRIVTRLTGDVETINEFFTSVLVAFLKDLSIMIGVLITIFFISPKLALVTVITLPPVFITAAISRIKARDAFRRQRTASSRVNSYLSERLSGVQVVQLFGQEKKSSAQFGERNTELLNANLSEMYVFSTFRPIIDFFANLTIAIVIAVGSSLAFNISLSIGVLIAFIGLVQMFYNPVQDIAEKYTLLQSAMAGGERVFKLLDTEESIPDTGTREIKEMLRGHITFKDVRFSYNKGEEILKGLSFTVNPGEMVAIVGYTGAGKTTIINVLSRLWDIDSGEILLDGIPIQDIPLDEVRRSILPVLQDVFLFSGTVADNIKLGLSLSDEEVEKAARAVHAHEFISRLPEGYNTILSEGATNISSGQRQLISFARVIAHNPSIVILDEATSSIDTETEHLIQLGIQEVLSGRTSIVIAHRLSTIKHADRILVLSGGSLVEEGNHQELIEKNGLYAKLYRLQYEE
ncbi:ABC transporter ATP-binding protein/permease [Brucepastera parasyntrophica]|uniref:ABC transporter ATP-binding protein n=1 Tax=Brucepastera parasyntrophica TaxID=2880008 RepID=UPI00210864F1|nr:ABC transporter ATP-binding protein [Brucepastera parasyntrophica]ULQ59653.1 ABC transporter ATP-binding protein/permease [Brucepastera parasyntrophica]